MQGVQVGRVVERFEIVGKTHAAALGLGFAQGAEFLAALGDQLVLIDGGGGGDGVLVRHEKRW
jgi:hypothetical protein